MKDKTNLEKTEFFLRPLYAIATKKLIEGNLNSSNDYLKNSSDVENYYNKKCYNGKKNIFCIFSNMVYMAIQNLTMGPISLLGKVWSLASYDKLHGYKYILMKMAKEIGIDYAEATNPKNSNETWYLRKPIVNLSELGVSFKLDKKLFNWEDIRKLYNLFILDSGKPRESVITKMKVPP